jgi:hypothetical protein
MIPHEPGSSFNFSMAGINNNQDKSSGQLHLRLLDPKGMVAVERKMEVTLEALQRTDLIATLNLPEQLGGYLLVAGYTPTGSSREIISRRYIRIGNLSQYTYFEMQPE